MKYILSTAVSLIIAAVLLSFLPVHGEELIYENVIRFHVIAESDSADDQALKLKVRDAVLEYISPILAECGSYEEAREILTRESGNIQSAAKKAVIENGYSYNVSAALVTEKYPTRVYDEISLPSGIYTSMKITIGAGNGKNWWCVLFPSVCRSFSGKSAEPEYIAVGFTPEQYRMITNDSSPEYKVRFKILELLSSLIGFEY